MESLALTGFANAYRGRRVLVTGHTGFKGSWLALWLSALGSEVSGFALEPPTSPSHWDDLSLAIADGRGDVRDIDAIEAAFAEARPEIVFHLAAQPLVLRGYEQPLETWSTNAMGTVNVLDACRRTSSVRAVVVVTTDKCYENRDWPWAYRESDRLGGGDPYSASKAAAELAAASFREAYFADARVLVATARGGNVIGGGDWASDRLIPDLARAVRDGQALAVRCPRATRPWQHVLDCLCGYLRLGQKLIERDARCADAWNFGPDPGDARTVVQLLAALRQRWPAVRWQASPSTNQHEKQTLQLDSARARTLLDWWPVWTLDEALDATAEWYRAYIANGSVCSHDQLRRYVDAARSREATWATA